MVSPSTIVDRVWHYHLLYTHSYWHNFCGKVLNKSLYHYPGGGRAEELVKDRHRYQATLELYQAYFGNPPVDIWDSAPLQSNHLAYRNRYLLIPNPLYWLNKNWLRSIAKISPQS